MTESCELNGEKKAKVRGYGPCVVVSAGGDKLVANAMRRTGWMRTIFSFVFFEARNAEENGRLKGQRTYSRPCGGNAL